MWYTIHVVSHKPRPHYCAERNEKIMADYWNGSYDTSREGQQSLADDIMDAGVGKFSYPTSDGGTVKVTDSSINAYFPSDSSPNGHSHYGVNSNGQTYHHD